MFRHALTHFGDVFSKAEVDDVFNEFEVDDDGYIESKIVIGLFVAGGGEEKKEEEKKEEEEKVMLRGPPSWCPGESHVNNEICESF